MLGCCDANMRALASQVRHLMFTWTLTNGIIDSVDQLEKALAAAVCAEHPSFLQVRQVLAIMDSLGIQRALAGVSLWTAAWKLLACF